MLSTYNGEPYLAEQLASFLAQSHTDWNIYWRDDGSSDGTVAVMAAFSTGPAAGRCIVCPEGGRLGACASFLSLLRISLQGEADFFAFSDQDDVWLPDKLAHGVTALREIPADQPGLWFCGRYLVDASLRPIGQVLAPRRQPGFPASLIQNLAPGCCMMLNRTAAALINAGPVPDGAWHDWWSYVVVSAHGGTVMAGNTADILYRQHGLNLVGEPPGFWHRTWAAIRRGRTPFMGLLWRQIAALRAGPVTLPGATQAQLAKLERANRGGLLARFEALWMPGLIRQTRTETLLFRLWLILG